MGFQKYIICYTKVDFLISRTDGRTYEQTYERTDEPDNYNDQLCRSGSGSRLMYNMQQWYAMV